MKAEIMKAAIRAGTNPAIYSLPSMKNLLLFISSAPGSPPPGSRPGTVGSHHCQPSGTRPAVMPVLTLVKSRPGRAACQLVKDRFSFMIPNRLAVETVFDPVNISGIYQGNVLPVPAGSGAPVSYRRSAPSTALMGKCPAWRPAWHWSASPAALSCKAQPEVSFLLY